MRPLPTSRRSRRVAPSPSISQSLPIHALPRGQEDIDALYGAEGKDLDDSYKLAQIDALTQVQADYQDYIAHGDDTALKALAVRELPKVTKRLAFLNKL